VKDTLNRADLVYANLEGLLAPSKGAKVDIPDKPDWTHPGPDGVKALLPANITVVGVANNVASGRRNIMRSLSVLDSHGIRHVGAGKNLEEAHRPVVVEKKDARIGFLQYTARWYRDEDMIATASEAGVARLLSFDGVEIDAADLARVRSDIRKLRPAVDILVVSHHNRDGSTPVQFGGKPGRSQGRDRTRAEPYQRQFAHAALDAGADLVFGHGTHAIQGVEVYEGKPILYAIGHSNFDQPGYEDAKEGLVVRVAIVNKAIRRVSFVPVTRDDKNDVFMLDPLFKEGAALVQLVRERSVDPPPLDVDGREVVLVDDAAKVKSER
jgi:poly-gamma-glutamate synthesis protein (capsule biosynthesis protein)